MSGKKLLLYLAVMLLVAGAYFFSESEHSRQQAREKESKQLFQVKVADIKTLTLKNDKGEINLQRVADPEKPSTPPSSGNSGSHTSGG